MATAELAGTKGEVALVANGPPLDYSFKELRTCAEIETEEPRSGVKRPDDSQEDEGGATLEAAPMTQTSALGGAATTNSLAATKTQGPKLKIVLKKVTICVKLNNNMLESVQGLPQALRSAMPSPLVNLQWLDMSFNQLVTIEPELLSFLNLKALYLHGNCIRTLGATDRLRKLPKLISLTLNGNPIESSKIYRCYVIGALPTLKSLDHSTITEDEHISAATWFKGHIRRATERKEKMEEAAALAME
eukprot:TRINITY_DN112324_c0_g1_i1.p1 TRINITY_DN112324_c0_g1~~TRINITY_DN112324_c0_g1_i1.p1  ORF type:complete len:247 (+),score=61.73 TRINITY_DN112324_c0_g1_i1:88-828(+)